MYKYLHIYDIVIKTILSANIFVALSEHVYVLPRKIFKMGVLLTLCERFAHTDGVFAQIEVNQAEIKKSFNKSLFKYPTQEVDRRKFSKSFVNTFYH